MHALLRTETPAPAPKRALAKAVREAVDAFLGEVEFRVRVRGQHYSGLSNQRLFDVRAEEGRDFLQRTVQMDQWVRTRMRATFRGWPGVPLKRELREAHTALVLEYIVTTRFAQGGGDIVVGALSPEYAAQKARDGYGGEPIGVRTGEHRDALLENGWLDYRT